MLTDYKDQNLDQQQLLLSPDALYRKGKDSAAPHWTRIDPRMAWLTDLLKQLKPAKVLVITAMRQTVLDIAEALKVRSGIHTAVFHEGMSLLERDRAAAYFADVEQGCQVLICSEIGSEGRNFQFAHHLVLFDLPLNPDLLEQRIGRLDRIGQKETIHIHVSYLENSAQSVMYHWYQEGLNAFTHPCPAGYTVFYQLQAPLLDALREATLAQHDIPEFIQRTRKLCHEVNRVLQEGRDRLLEYNSCRPEVAAGLKQAAEQQDAASTIEQFMDNVFDCFGVHVEEHGRSSFIIRPSEKMHAPYPGLHDEGMTITYNRATALANEDMQFLTWEHPMVITGIDLVLSNEFGNAVVCTMEHKALQPGTLLLESLYVLEPARLAGTQVSGYFPPVIFRILVDERGNVRHDAINHDAVNAGADVVETDIARRVIQMKEDSGQLAEEQVPAIIGAAKARIEQSLSSELTRLEALSRVNKNIRAEELDYCRRQRQLLVETAGSAKLRLDALRVIVVTKPD
ncbi:MAG: RNA polymerase recycling-like protein [Gammaproteobacteria bacterium]|nr:RNA polymerase recycling-like protein [Gammaproteobacteria bacterium]